MLLVSQLLLLTMQLMLLVFQFVGLKLVTPESELVTRGFELVTRVLLFHSEIRSLSKSWVQHHHSFKLCWKLKNLTYLDISDSNFLLSFYYKLPSFLCFLEKQEALTWKLLACFFFVFYFNLVWSLEERES